MLIFTNLPLLRNHWFFSVNFQGKCVTTFMIKKSFGGLTFKVKIEVIGEVL